MTSPRLLVGGALVVLAGALYFDMVSRSGDQAGQVVEGAPAPKHVVLVVIDTLRADSLTAYGNDASASPAIARLASRGLVFDSAFATSPYTLASVTSLFGGTAEFVNPETVMGTYSSIVPTFRAAGFRTGAVVANPWLGSYELFAAGFDRRTQSSSWGATTTESVTERALELLELGADAERSFTYVHFLDPHAPYQPAVGEPLSVKTLSGARRLQRQVKRRRAEPGEVPRPLPSAWPAMPILRRDYRREVGIVDAAVGRIVGRLQELGVYDDTLLVIASDHGEEFLEHGLLQHGYQLFDETLRIPLLFHYPKGIVPGRRADLASILDIPPTILGLAGLPTSERFQGIDLLTEQRGADDAIPLRSYFQNQQLHGFRSARYKWMYDLASDRARAYDLARDPAEREPIQDPELLAQLGETYRQLLVRYGDERTVQPDEGTAGAQMDEAVKKELEALGYILP